MQDETPCSSAKMGWGPAGVFLLAKTGECHLRVNNEVSWSWHSQEFVSAGDLGSCVVFSPGTLLESSREGSATSSVTRTGYPSCTGHWD